MIFGYFFALVLCGEIVSAHGTGEVVVLAHLVVLQRSEAVIAAEDMRPVGFIGMVRNAGPESKRRPPASGTGYFVMHGRRTVMVLRTLCQGVRSGACVAFEAIGYGDAVSCSYKSSVELGYCAL